MQISYLEIYDHNFIKYKYNIKYYFYKNLSYILFHFKFLTNLFNEAEITLLIVSS
jgi:hypothetical protein